MKSIYIAVFGAIFSINTSAIEVLRVKEVGSGKRASCKRAMKALDDKIEEVVNELKLSFDVVAIEMIDECSEIRRGELPREYIAKGRILYKAE